MFPLHIYQVNLYLHLSITILCSHIYEVMQVAYVVVNIYIFVMVCLCRSPITLPKCQSSVGFLYHCVEFLLNLVIKWSILLNHQKHVALSRLAMVVLQAANSFYRQSFPSKGKTNSENAEGCVFSKGKEN